MTWMPPTGHKKELLSGRQAEEDMGLFLKSILTSKHSFGQLHCNQVSYLASNYAFGNGLQNNALHSY